MLRDISSDLNVVLALQPTTVSDNTAMTGTAVDLANHGSCMFAIQTGSLADADATFAVEIQESDASGSGYTAVADDHLVGTESGAGFTFAADNAVRKIGYIGAKRYVRIVITPANNSGSATASAVAILGHGRVQPKAQPS